jgi:predicted MFS family arabinose efflux permease
VRALLLLLLTTSMFGGAYAALLPAVAEDTLRGGADTLGWLMGATGAGALSGALYLASREETEGLRTLLPACAFILGAGLIALELATSVWIAVPILFVVGMAMMVQWAATNTLVQTVVDDSKLGRVMSLYALTFFGGAPLGALMQGSLASVIGPIHTLAIAGACCAACALAFGPAIARRDEGQPA